jgi:hypothetical protein
VLNGLIGLLAAGAMVGVLNRLGQGAWIEVDSMSCRSPGEPGQ